VVCSPRIVFGDDAVEVLENEKPERTIMVTDKSLSKLGYVEEVQKYLKSEIKIFDEVEPEQSIETALKCAKFAREFNPDLVALGDRSVLDVAKITRILLEIDISPGKITPFMDLREPRFKKIAKLIPTSSGTSADF